MNVAVPPIPLRATMAGFRRFTVDELKKRKSRTVTATLECGGNGADPGFMGAIGNIRWTGTPLVDLLQARPQSTAAPVAHHRRAAAASNRVRHLGNGATGRGITHRQRPRPNHHPAA